MNTGIKKIVLDNEWARRPLITRTEGTHLATHLGLHRVSTIHIELDAGVTAMSGFWMGLCESFVLVSSTLADLYNRVSLVQATPAQRREFERAMCRAMGRAYTQPCKKI